ncbi:MAG: twin-arginine translocase TatA/TatE family subunit [Actinomycetota bacterium]|nr:twin-arginine translocase TatA/TatE family subunit [Actinomycetota bacterium]
MLRGLFEGPGIWVVLAVVVLLFGATRLPALARSIGQSTKIFREEMKTDKPAEGAAGPGTVENTVEAPTAAPATTAPAVPTTADPGTSGTAPKS